MKHAVEIGVFFTIAVLIMGVAWWLSHAESFILSPQLAPSVQPPLGKPVQGLPDVPPDTQQVFPSDAANITDFTDCVAAGYPVAESFPRQCRTANGRLFVEDVTVDDAPPNSRARDGCVITGCSGQLCADEELVSTCEYKEEYACYRNALCVRKDDGACGWVETMEIVECLADARGGTR
ncbi:MAG: hypothetical protein COT39_00870 [Parcubacteria group bacterium CG08_land_8_20_14_0_20_48_21]|nr:MAG: hypothetical protein AUK21_02300 [Parcubacteria group bacterium CG2_30_48_51]PIS33013.1 MAG: hypothetical protein COT39_00870 [Parcubacteria group bacterium CG08_land_8_20_14_0_20_48_21]PJE52684.1 MAG: hypothetical protein COV80_02620 [Parcubacteria group bacterium CG11_big_fil_rev_8_21_14_0_20_48_46]